MANNIFANAKKVAKGVEQKRAARQAAEEAKKAQEAAIAADRRNERGKASALVDSLDTKLLKIFSGIADSLKQSGLKNFKYSHMEMKDEPISSLGRVVTHVFDAQSIEPLKIVLCVHFKNKKDYIGEKDVSCHITNYQEAKEYLATGKKVNKGKGPVVVEEGREDIIERDETWDGMPYETVVGSRKVREYYPVTAASTPAAAGPIKKALSTWFTSLARNSEDFSRLLATGEIKPADLKMDFSFLPEKAARTQRHTASGGCIKKEPA